MRVLDLFRQGYDTKDIAKRTGLPEHVVLYRLHTQRCAEKGLPCQVLRRGLVITLVTEKVA